MAYAKSGPVARDLILLFRDFERFEVDISRDGETHIMESLLPLMSKFREFVQNLKPVPEDRDGIQKKKSPSRITETNAVVRRHTIRNHSSGYANSGGPDTEPSPTESERYHSDPDVGQLEYTT